MSAIVLIPWAKTDWSASGRLSAKTPVPINDEGSAQAEHWGQQLQEKHVQVLFTSGELTSLETANAVAKSAGTRVKQLEGLSEVGLGLWEGLTAVQLKSRFPKIYKRWMEDPVAVHPPEGEDLEVAAERIAEALEKAAKKAGDAVAGIVLGPIALAVARCELEHVHLRDLRSKAANEPVWYESANGRSAAGSAHPGESIE